MTRRSNSPDSNRIPENRNGTQSYRAYYKSMVQGNLSGCNTIVRATARQQKKAQKMFYAGVKATAVKGRVLRTLVRSEWVFYGSACDDLMGEHHGRNY